MQQREADVADPWVSLALELEDLSGVDLGCTKAIHMLGLDQLLDS